jgi:hypothetical protein
MLKKTDRLRGGLTAAVFACSLAVFGCSTNRTPGDGQPSMTPLMNPAATPGSSWGTTNPPMASAMDVSNNVQRANDAAAIVAAHQRERFLGYINPVGPQPTPPDQMPVTGQVIPPSQYANPESTVNSSISSEPTPVISSGGAGSGAATFAAAPATVSAPATGVTSSATATPTTAALSATPGQFAAGASTTSTTAAATTVANTAALTPTLSSAATPSPTRAANPPLASIGVTSSTTTPTSSATSSTAATGRLVLPNGVVTNGSVRAVTNATGAVIITNMPVVIKSK